MPRGQRNQTFSQRYASNRNAAITFQLTLSGEDAFVKAFNEMPIRIRKNVLQKMVAAETKNLAKTARTYYPAFANIRTGALQKSLLQNRTPRSYRMGALKMSFVQARAEASHARAVKSEAASEGRKVNPRFFTATKKIRKRAAKLGLTVGKDIKPNKYAHLVENGQYLTRKTKAFLFLEQTWKLQGKKVLRGMLRHAPKAVEQELQKLINKHSKRKK
jgi:hypothetical protein